MTRLAVLLLAASLLAGDPPAVKWSEDTVTPICPVCRAEVPLSCVKCPGCNEALTWKDLAFDATPAGAFMKLKYALKYKRPDLLKECLEPDVYTAAEAERFGVDGGPLAVFLHARIKRVERDGDLARIQFESGEGGEARSYTFQARRDGEAWRLGPPKGKEGRDAGANEALVVRDLCEVLEAERRWREGDVDGNARKDYWTRDVAGLRAWTGAGGKPAGLLREDLARADAAGAKRYPSLGEPRPTHGYWYQVLRLDRRGRRCQRDLDGDGAPFENADDFAVCAWPDRYGDGGRRTFLLSATGGVLRKDLGAAAARVPVPDPSEAPISAVERHLGRLLAKELDARRDAVEGILDVGPSAAGPLRAALDREDLRPARATIGFIIEALDPMPGPVDRVPVDPKADGWTAVPILGGPR